MTEEIPTQTDAYSKLLCEAAGTYETWGTAPEHFMIASLVPHIYYSNSNWNVQKSLTNNFLRSFVASQGFNENIFDNNKIFTFALDYPRANGTALSGQDFEMVSDLDIKIAKLNSHYEKEKEAVKEFLGNKSTVFDDSVKNIIVTVSALKIPTINLELRDEATIIFKLKLDDLGKIMFRYHLDEPSRCTYSYFKKALCIENGVGSLKDVILDIKKIIFQARIQTLLHSRRPEINSAIENWKNSFVDVLSSGVTTQI
ncbi:hypothetical protein [Ohtaekwangia koreensis]|uniref:Uncharacterized protein n=1 Tax=Ohtaekwangia koreensis TaxID=688867 RepID=A0A1T5LCH1_9BACT|nr:hypothetical protein [Ohtaekwangia koreensis]SKC73584.1 hypothetical protein SAMN05660236_2948 [Ohtaekwangia koreensis]